MHASPRHCCRFRLLRLTVLLLTSTSPVAVTYAEQPQPTAGMQAAFSERDITPEIGMEQPGGYGKAYHRSIHDPCKVRVALFAHQSTQVVVVSVDALLVRRQLVTSVRRKIESDLGIPGEAILIHATHSHSSGPTGMIYPGEFDGATELVQELAYTHSSNANLEYVTHVENQIVGAVEEALEKLASCQCSVGVGYEDEVAFNRRFLMRDGLTFTHPRQGNPAIVRPAGPIDPEVGVLGVWSDDNQLQGCIINYSCHATTNPGGASANYIYYLERVIRGCFGDNVIVVFLAGASGDITQVDNRSPLANPRPEQWARIVGASIGAEAVKVLVKAEPGQLGTLAHDRQLLSIARRPPSAERLASALELAQQDPEEVDRTEWTFAKELVLLDAIIAREPVVEVEVQAIQIGPVVLLTDPAEFFCQLGLDIKRDSDFPVTFPVSLANGCVGYVPDEQAFERDGGGYETRLTSYSNLDISAGRQMVNAAVELARRLQPEEIPTRAPAPPFRHNPWSYGAVPPEID